MKVQKKNKGHTKEKLWQHELSGLVVEFFDNVIKYLTKNLKQEVILDQFQKF